MKKKEASTAFFLARKNISRNISSLLFTVLIIALGFISSTIIYGALWDTQENIQQDYIETSMGHIVIEPYGDAEQIEDSSSMLKKIRVLPNIVGVGQVTKKQARFYDKDGKHVDSEVYIINPEDFAKISVVDNIIKEGSYLNKGEKEGLVLGCINIKKCNPLTSFDRIDVGVGNKIFSVFDANRAVNLTLRGIYDHRFIQTEIMSYISEDTAKTIFEDYDSNKADMILISLPSRDYTDQAVLELSKLNLHAKISTWREKSTKYSSIIDSFLIIGDLSFLIGVVISAISIYIVLYINILNKKSQIGIIRAIGIRSRVVSLSYVLVSLFLGIIGSIFGVLLTLLMIQYFNFHPIETGIGLLVPKVTSNVFLLVSSSIILASVISGYLVSNRVTKYNIIDAISNG